MDLAVRMVKVGDGTYRGRVEVGGVSVFTTQAAYGSRSEAREAAVRTLAEALGALMAEHEVVLGSAER